MKDFLGRSLEIARPGIVESHTGVEQAHADVVGGGVNLDAKIRVGLGKIALARLDGVRAGDLTGMGTADAPGRFSTGTRTFAVGGPCG